jgi:hypothetical protein
MYYRISRSQLSARAKTALPAIELKALYKKKEYINPVSVHLQSDRAK